MSFESQTLGVLTGATEITDLVPAADIYFGTAPFNADAPFIYCQKTFTDSGPTTDNGNAGTHRLDNIEMQVTVYQTTYAVTNALAQAVRTTLEGERTIRYILKDQFSSFDDLPDLHGQILLFSAWYQSQT